MDSIARLYDRVQETLAKRPGTTLLVSHAVTTAAFLYVVSEGKPLQYIKKKLFQAVLAAVPSSVVDAELDKVKASIEDSIISHHLDGETLVRTVPEHGWSKDEVLAALERYGDKDSKLWRSGKVLHYFNTSLCVL